jgi:hypothetical protein
MTRLGALKQAVRPRTRLVGARNRLLLRAHDWRVNRRWRGEPKRFLVVRHAGKNPKFYDVILQWVEEHVPEIRRLFELRLLPCWISDWSPYVLHVPWLQDPVENWSRRAYARACRLSAACDRYHVPVINRVDRLSNAMKFETSRRLSRAGIRTPVMRVIGDHREFRETGCGVPLPLFVREDAGHNGLMLRAHTERELRAIPLKRFRRPIAVELVDVRSPEDGLFRKFRYVVAGRVGVPHHMQATQDWITRGDIRFHNETTRSQEEVYVSRPDPHHEVFQRARTSLGLDFVAFDYGFDRRGELIIWDANPYPHFHIPKRRLSYLKPAMHRTLAAVVHLYVERAGMAIPHLLQDVLFTSPGVTWDTGRESARDPNRDDDRLSNGADPERTPTPCPAPPSWAVETTG